MPDAVEEEVGVSQESSAEGSQEARWAKARDRSAAILRGAEAAVLGGSGGGESPVAQGGQSVAQGGHSDGGEGGGAGGVGSGSSQTYSLESTSWSGTSVPAPPRIAFIAGLHEISRGLAQAQATLTAWKREGWDGRGGDHAQVELSLDGAIQDAGRAYRACLAILALAAKAG